jgi:hypothetical protein
MPRGYLGGTIEVSDFESLHNIELSVRDQNHREWWQVTDFASFVFGFSCGVPVRNRGPAFGAWSHRRGAAIMATYRLFTNDRGTRGGVAMYSALKQVQAWSADAAPPRRNARNPIRRAELCAGEGDSMAPRVSGGESLAQKTRGVIEA